MNDTANTTNTTTTRRWDHPDFQVFTDCSGDACPPDNRYAEYCMKVMAKRPLIKDCPEAIADAMRSLASMYNKRHTYLHRPSCVKEAKKALGI